MHAGKEKFNDHSRELELTRKLYNYYELLGGVPTGDLVLIEKEVAVVEGEEKWQIENMEGVGCINNKYRSSLLVGLEIEDEPFDVPEDKKGKRSKKKRKKFGSLLIIQNSKISESERKRDRALKRRNWNKLQFEESELSGKSLSDSDISNQVSKIVNEAKQVLKFDNKIGFNIVGDENGLINYLVDLELKEGKSMEETILGGFLLGIDGGYILMRF
ncbi:hypothetical protein V6N13_032150 [Hibiscus sabdariffa]